MDQKLPDLVCKPDWALVCTPAGCGCEYRAPGSTPPPPPAACQPPAQIYCAGTMCMCTSLTLQAPPILEAPAPGADCGVMAALAASAIFRALLACR